MPKQLLEFSKQVALGLHYLSCRGFVHRDLAARNILVSNMLCKVLDIIVFTTALPTYLDAHNCMGKNVFMPYRLTTIPHCHDHNVAAHTI